MKKFLVMLMVVAMASFLFVGCLPGVTPPADDVDDEDVDVGPASTAPIITEVAASGSIGDPIINLYSSATQYMNKTEVYYGIVVSGNAPKYSEVSIYIDGVVVSTGVAYGTSETFVVFVAKADLGADGAAKTLSATATETGLAESAHSTEYTFTLDVVAPTISVAVADSGDNTLTVTFNEPVDTNTYAASSTALIGTTTATGLTSALNTTLYTLDTNGVDNLSAGYAVSTSKVRFTADVAPTQVSFWVAVDTVKDLAGNGISVSAPSTFSGIVTP